MHYKTGSGQNGDEIYCKNKVKQTKQSKINKTSRNKYL
jgi:hypothetical protein